ncbi:putative dihydropteroate synthase [Actinoplanes missouriensis 431]|uniref:Dihydropteroate synthase n=1 Tax=Actinoplanes missouriensis (strain ATCC 14538 / DSM 43046 / CBS 188.64 / JCM 3121 / NBRC 102363 / NCIMB 12654 / NRRL B-3342 / UNCC 431) TaxID=512565 RepID=I0HB60_ACTM4|nr:dihydropteroate synthase [Actinoplanes missouriensis]BAL90247.1 putative dihydropteroate synthase [Actinoplanes missouriensis 431]
MSETSGVRVIGGRTYDFSRRVVVMAIVNRTPDSFHDRGRTFALEKATEAVQAAADDGADWIDIGGVPFAPGPEVSAAEELERVLPVVEAARDRAVVSVDTFRPEVAREVIKEGAGVINDTSGLRDPAMADAVAGTDAQLVITHSLAAPRTLHPRPEYGDVTAEVAAFLRERVELALSRGVRPDQIIIDPGHDLNKNTLHSLAITRRLEEITSIGYPTLAALSNKDFIGETLGRPQHERLAGTLATVVFCILHGARIMRVHDVRAAVDAVRMTEAMLGWREPAYLRHNMD